VVPYRVMWCPGRLPRRVATVDPDFTKQASTKTACFQQVKTSAVMAVLRRTGKVVTRATPAVQWPGCLPPGGPAAVMALTAGLVNNPAPVRAAAAYWSIWSSGRPTKWLVIPSKEAWIRVVALRRYYQAARPARLTETGLFPGLIFLPWELHARGRRACPGE
jgi:hypothetical protein